MKIIKRTLIALCLSGCVLTGFAQKDTQNSMTNAVLKVYQEELAENPQNYNVYFRRAHLYYGLNQYLRALSDVDNALKYTPDTDKDMLILEYALRSNIYQMLDRKEEALADITKTCELDPGSYTYLYQKANLEYQVGNYEAAKNDYKKMQRMQNRSLESLVGLARVAVKENNLGLANEYLDQAVAMYPAEGEAYLRRASVRSLMGNNNGAVDDLLIALSLDKNTGKPFNEIVKMGNTDYNAVITGLSNAMTKAPDSAIFYLLRAVIAQTHFHFSSAIADYNTLIDRKLYDSPTIHGGLAECYYALCEYDKAMREINIAIGTSADNATYYVTRSKIRLAMGDDQVAMESAESALRQTPENISALLQKANCAIKMGKYEMASNVYGEIIVSKPNETYAYLVRGWLLKNYLNKAGDANTFFARAADIEVSGYEMRTLHPFALQALGQNKEACEWTKKALETKDVDGYAHYLGACLYAQAGEINDAFDALNTAFTLGFDDLNMLRNENTANLNVAPLRSDPRFEDMLTKYSYLFK